MKIISKLGTIMTSFKKAAYDYNREGFSSKTRIKLP